MGTVLPSPGRGRAILVAVGLTIAGLLTAELATLPVFFVEPDLLEGFDAVSRNVFLVAFSLNFVGMAAAGAIYLWYTGRGWSYVDIRMPTLRDWKYAILGLLGVFAFSMIVSIFSQALNVPGTDSQIVDIVGDDATLALIMIIPVFLFNAPAEEFLFRNIIQKRLYDAFSQMHAILVASVIFALVHFPMYAATTDSMVAVGVSLTVMFGGSVVFGYIYVKTENLFAPTVAHALFNSFTFLALYAMIEYDIEDLETAAIVIGL